MIRSGSEYGPFASDGLGELSLGTHILHPPVVREVLQIEVPSYEYATTPQTGLMIERGAGSAIVRREDRSPLQVEIVVGDDRTYGDRGSDRTYRLFAQAIPFLYLQHVEGDLWNVGDDEVQILGENRLEMLTSTIAMWGVTRQRQAQTRKLLQDQSRQE